MIFFRAVATAILLSQLGQTHPVQSEGTNALSVSVTDSVNGLKPILLPRHGAGHEDDTFTLPEGDDGESNSPGGAGRQRGGWRRRYGKRPSRGGFEGGQDGSRGGIPSDDEDTSEGGSPGGSNGGSGGVGDTPTSDKPTDPTNLDAVAQESLEVHNRLRANHGAPALVWDETLAAAAKATSDKCAMNHEGPYGQNLAAGYSTVREAVEDAWYTSEKSSQGGHYTQVIWKSSQKLGCALSTCNTQFGNMYTCNYYPPGNVQGQYDQNT